MEGEGYLVEAEGICVNFGARSVLTDVDLRISAGEVVTLVGLNGAGKSTLVEVVLGLLSPTRGTVRRRPGLRIGYTPQQLNRDPSLPMSVRRFMTLGAKADDARLRELLGEAGADGLLEQQLVDLSGGELHRVLLARALLREPELLVLDEPLTGVDITGQAELYRLIAGIRKRRGCGVLLISHDLHLVMGSADRVLCLNNHLCCTGHPETVANHPEFINLFGRQMADNLGVYVHHHDHSHEIDGSVTPDG